MLFESGLGPRNSRIRAYDLETGIITTKVGTGHGYAGEKKPQHRGFSSHRLFVASPGDGGAPNEAKLSGPTGVVCDDLRGWPQHGDRRRCAYHGYGASHVLKFKIVYKRFIYNTIHSV